MLVAASHDRLDRGEDHPIAVEAVHFFLMESNESNISTIVTTLKAGSYRPARGR